MKKNSLIKPQRGFTLVELLVTISMFSVLLVGLLVAIDPMNQLYKLWDAQRKHDLTQIKTAVDKYYNDHNCYPTSIPFGGVWEEDGTMYMKKVPKEEHVYCNAGNNCFPYYYQTDGSECPQWAVLYAHLTSKGMDKTDEKKKNCPLWIRSNLIKDAESFNEQGEVVSGESCNRILSAHNYCIFSGDIDCASINDDTYAGVSRGTLYPTVAPTTNPQLSPSPEDVYHSCSSGQCNQLDEVSKLNCKQFVGDTGIDCYINDPCCNCLCEGQCEPGRCQ